MPCPRRTAVQSRATGRASNRRGPTECLSLGGHRLPQLRRHPPRGESGSCRGARTTHPRHQRLVVPVTSWRPRRNPTDLLLRLRRRAVTAEQRRIVERTVLSGPPAHPTRDRHLAPSSRPRPHPAYPRNHRDRPCATHLLHCRPDSGGGNTRWRARPDRGTRAAAGPQKVVSLL